MSVHVCLACGAVFSARVIARTAMITLNTVRRQVRTVVVVGREIHSRVAGRDVNAGRVVVTAKDAQKIQQDNACPEDCSRDEYLL